MKKSDIHALLVCGKRFSEIEGTDFGDILLFAMNSAKEDETGDIICLKCGRLNECCECINFI